MSNPKTQATPGPRWRYQEVPTATATIREVVAGVGDFQRLVARLGHEMTEREGRMVAAAPQMRDALVAAESFLHAMAGTQTARMIGTDGKRLLDGIRIALRAARGEE